MNLVKKRWYIFVGIVLLFLIIYQRQQSSQIKLSKDSQPYTVIKKNLKDELALSGAIDASEQATLRFPAAGKVVWVGVQEGDRVKKYQGLASMDTRSVNKVIQTYLNTFTKTRSVFDQTKDTNQGTMQYGMTQELRDAAQRLITESQSDLDNSVLNLEIQTLAKESSYLYSPIEGIVTRAPKLLAGMNITIPTQAEYEVINPDTLYFSASADQTDVVKLHEGMLAEIVFDPYPESTISAQINSIGFTPQTNETGTEYEVKIGFDPTGLDYKLGMTGDATFVLGERKDVLVIPQNYVKTENNTFYVIKLKNNKKIKQTIQTGDTLDGETVITSGLQEGDTIYD